MLRKVIAFVLVVCLVSVLALSVSAGTSSNYIAGIRVTATCNKQSSSHMIEKSNGTGTARIYYTENGVTHNINVPGSSSSAYWSAYKTLAGNQYAYKATTTYSGSTVTAVYP